MMILSAQPSIIYQSPPRQLVGLRAKFLILLQRVILGFNFFCLTDNTK